MPSKGRLLIACLDPGDFRFSREAWARAAREQGFEVHVALPASAAGASGDWGGIDARWPVHAFAFSRGSVRPDRVARAVWSLWRLYRRLRPDLVHHVHGQMVVVGSIAARLARVPAVVNTVGGLGIVYASGRPRDRLLRFAYGLGYRLAFGHPRQRVTAENSEDVRELVRLGAGATRTLQTPGAGIDLDRFAPRVRSASDRVTVLLASRLLWSKGLLEYVEAARALASTGARFVIAGAPDPANRDSVPLAQLEAWDREGAVEYLGQVEDMPALLAEADVVCLPTAYREGIPRIVLEAAAAGRPVVTTSIPGCREAVVDGVTGLLVPPRDVPALTSALRRLIEDRALRESMGPAARERAVAEFGAERVTSMTLGLYLELTEGRIEDRAARRG